MSIATLNARPSWKLLLPKLGLGLAVLSLVWALVSVPPVLSNPPIDSATNKWSGYFLPIPSLSSLPSRPSNPSSNPSSNLSVVPSFVPGSPDAGNPVLSPPEVLAADPSATPGEIPAEAAPETEMAPGSEDPSQIAEAYNPLVPMISAPSSASAGDASSSSGSTPSPSATPDSNVPVIPPVNLALLAGQTLGGSPGAQAAPANPASQFTAQDLSLLETGIKAVMATQNIQVAGTVYGSGTGPNAQSTGYSTSTTVSTSRWTWTEGLESEAGITIQAPSATSISLQLRLRIIGANAASQEFTANASAVSPQVRSEVRNARQYRVFTLNFGNVTLPGRDAEGESAILRSLRVVLSFDVTDPAQPGVGNDAQVTFGRTRAQMASIAWAGAPLAPTDPGILADQANYSMIIEKLP